MKELNTELLAKDLKFERDKRSLTLRGMSNETKVSHATLSRLENGKLPDVNTFICICQWLEQPMERYVTTKRELAEQKIRDYNEKINNLMSERAKIQKELTP